LLPISFVGYFHHIFLAAISAFFVVHFCCVCFCAIFPGTREYVYLKMTLDFCLAQFRLTTRQFIHTSYTRFMHFVFVQKVSVNYRVLTPPWRLSLTAYRFQLHSRPSAYSPFHLYLIPFLLKLCTIISSYIYCNVDDQNVSRQRPVNNLQSRKRTQQ
jgi:hypothetical protein